MQLGEAFITVSLTLSPTSSRSIEGTAKTAGTNAGQAFAKAFSEASNKLTVKNPDVEATYRKAGTTAGKAMATALSAEANKFTVKGPDAKLSDEFGRAGTKAGTALGKNLSESAVKATDLRKITPDTRVESTFGSAGGKAGTKFGTELSTNAKKTVHLDNITPPTEIERRFQEAGKKAGTSFGAAIGPAGKGAVNLAGIAPPASIVNTFKDAGTKAGKELGGSIGASARGAVDLKGIAPPATLTSTFHESGVKAGKELGGSIGPAARGAVDLKGIAPPSALTSTFHDAGAHAGKELGSSIGPAARGAVDLKGIVPPATLSNTFKDAGTRAGKELGSSIGPNARGAVDLKGIVPPASLKATFGNAGSEAGKAFGSDLSRMAKQAVDLRNLTPPATIKTSFAEAGTAAGTSFGTNLQERVRTGVEGMVAKVKAGAAQAEAAMRSVGTRAGTALSNSLNESTKTRLNGLNTSIKGAFAGLPASMGAIGGNSAGEFTKRFDEKLRGIKDSIKTNLVQGAAMLGPAAFVGAIAGIVKVGTQYENSMNMFKAITKATDAQMKEAASTAIKLGNDVKLPGVSAADAADAMSELSKSGLNVNDSMKGANAVLALSRVADMDAAKAAGIAAGAMNTFGLKAEDLTSVIDNFANVANSSSVDVKDVADSFKMASAVFAGFLGPSIGAKNAMQDLNVAIGILGQNGIKGSDAGTSLKQMLLQLTGPSNTAKSAIDAVSAAAFDAGAAQGSFSKELKNNGKFIGEAYDGNSRLKTALMATDKASRDAALNQIYKSNPALQNMGTFAYDAAGKMRPLRDQIAILSKGLAGMTEEEKAHTLTQIYGADATRSVIALLHSGVPAYDAMAKAIGRQGAAADLAKAKNAGMAGAFDAVRGSVETAAIGIYKALSKPVTGGLFTAAEKLPGMFKVIGQEAGKLIGPLGQVVTFVGNVIKAFAPLAGTLGVAVWLALRTAIQAVGLVLTPLNALMSAHTTTSKILGTAIGVIVIAYNAEKIALVATTVLTKTWGIVTGASAAIARGAAIATNLWTAAQWLLNAAFRANPIGVVITVITALVAVIVLAYNKNKWFHDLVVSAWAGIKVAMSAVADWFVKTAWPAIKVALDAMGAAFTWLWKNAIVPAWNGIKTAVTAAWPTIKAIFDVGVTVIKAYGAVYTWLWNNAVKPAWDGIKVVITVAWAAIMVILKAAEAYLKVWGAVFTWLNQNIIKPAWDAIKTVISAGWAAIQVVLNSASASLKVWGAIFTWLNVNIIKPAWEGIKTVISVAWAGVQVILNAGATFLRTWAAVFTWLRDNIIKPVWDGIKIAIQVAWVAIQIVYKSWEIAGKLLAIAVQWFWTAVIKPTWTAISSFLTTTWNTIKTTVFDAWGTYMRGPFMAMWNWFKTTFTALWTAIKTFLLTTWTSIKTTIFDAWAAYIKGPFVAMWNTFKTFFTTLWTAIKTFLMATWTAIKTTVFDVWAAYIKGPFIAMWNAFKAFFTALWAAIKSMLVAAWSAIKTTVFDAWSSYIKGPFTAMWNAFKAFITACWSAIKAAISAAWNWLKSSVFAPMVAYIKGPVVAGWTAMKTGVLNVWNGLKTGLSTTWNWIKSNIFTPLMTFVTKNVPDAFRKAVDFIKTAWSKLTAIVGDPVKTFVSKVINGWIIGGFNKIASKVGVGTITPVTFATGGIVPAQNAAQGGQGQSRGFAVGGVMPGYTPGRDVHKFYSPTGGRLDLSGGEAVMRPEFTKAVGPATVHKLNSAARSGGISGVKSALGLASGGIIGSPGAHTSMANGGIIDTASSWWEAITNMTKSVVNVIGDATGGIAGVTHASPYLKSIFMGIAKTLISGTQNFVRQGHTGGGSAGQTNVIGSTKGVGSAPGYQWMINALQKLGLGARITSTTGGGHAPGSYHYQGRAIDIGNESMAMFNAIKKNFGAQSMELIYGPAGGGNIWHGKPHNYGAATLAAHYNHIHWAMANGGVFAKNNANSKVAKYDSGGWLEPGMTGINKGNRPEAVLTPEESAGLKGIGAGELLAKLDELIDAVERVAPGVGQVMRGTGTSLRTAGRSV